MKAAAVDNFGDYIKGVVISVDSKKTEESHYAEHSECDRAAGKEDGEIIWQERKDIYNAFKGKNIFPDSFGIDCLGI